VAVKMTGRGSDVTKRFIWYIDNESPKGTSLKGLNPRTDHKWDALTSRLSTGSVGLLPGTVQMYRAGATAQGVAHFAAFTRVETEKYMGKLFFLSLNNARALYIPWQNVGRACNIFGEILGVPNVRRIWKMVSTGNIFDRGQNEISMLMAYAYSENIALPFDVVVLFCPSELRIMEQYGYWPGRRDAAEIIVSPSYFDAWRPALPQRGACNDMEFLYGKFPRFFTTWSMSEIGRKIAEHGKEIQQAHQYSPWFACPSDVTCKELTCRELHSSGKILQYDTKGHLVCVVNITSSDYFLRRFIQSLYGVYRPVEKSWYGEFLGLC